MKFVKQLFCHHNYVIRLSRKNKAPFEQCLKCGKISHRLSQEKTMTAYIIKRKDRDEFQDGVHTWGRDAYVYKWRQLREPGTLVPG